MTRAATVSTEKNIQAACVDWMNTLPGVKVWRQNTGKFLQTYTRKRDSVTTKRMIRFGENGQGDITGIGPGGVRMEIEAKRPGEYPSLDQQTWMQFINDHGGIAFWFDSLYDCVTKMRAAFLARGLEWRKSWEVS